MKRVALVCAAVFLTSCTSGVFTGDTTEQAVKVYRLDVELALRSASQAQEVFHAQNGTYASDLNALISRSGLSVSPDVTIAVISADPTAYCMEGTHTKLPDVTYRMAKGDSVPTEGTC